jgi:hypothetical protein
LEGTLDPRDRWILLLQCSRFSIWPAHLIRQTGEILLLSVADSQFGTLDYALAVVKSVKAAPPACGVNSDPSFALL